MHDGEYAAIEGVASGSGERRDLTIRRRLEPRSACSPVQRFTYARRIPELPVRTEDGIGIVSLHDADCSMHEYRPDGPIDLLFDGIALGEEPILGSVD